MKKSFITEIILFLILLIILTFLGLKVFKHTFDIGTTYHVEFNDIDSIVIGSPVRILGVDIGHVTKIQNNNDKIYIDFVITDDRIKLPQGTEATIEFFGIAGSRSIELTPPDKNSNGHGIIVKDPIRIGDAFGIMEEFLKATMASIAGIYEFAKGRTQEDAAKDTAGLLNATDEADDKIINFTSAIEKGGANFQKNINSTTNGMTRLYNETQIFNFGENYSRAKHGIRVTRRSLKNANKNIKILNNKMKFKTITLNIQQEKVKNIKSNINSLKQIDEAIESFSKALKKLDSDLSQENLDKVYDSFENIKIQSADLENSI